MVAEAEKLAAIHPNVVIKIPMLPEGIKAVKTLETRGIKTNVTLVFSANQALLAALPGPATSAPSSGGSTTPATTGSAVVADIVEIFDTYGFDTQVIAASIRHPLHVVAAAQAGATLPRCLTRYSCRCSNTRLPMSASSASLTTGPNLSLSSRSAVSRCRFSCGTPRIKPGPVGYQN